MLWYLVPAVISSSAGVIGMGMWCSASIDRMRRERDEWKAGYNGLDNALCKCQTDYATERRKRLDAEQAHTDLADKHNLALGKLEAIRSIPNNGKKPNGGLLKAQRIAGAV